MNTVSWISPAQCATTENVSKEVKMLEELLNLPKSPPAGPGPGTLSLPYSNYSLPEPRSTLMSGPADQTLKVLPRSEMALMATLNHQQITGSMNNIASSLFQSTSAVLYTGHCVGGDSNSLAALACSLNIPSVSSEGMPPHAATQRLFPNFTPTSYQFVRPFEAMDSSAITYMQMKQSAYEKENLYKNYVMHGSHFLCDSDMSNNEMAPEVPDLNDTLRMHDMESLEEIIDFLTPEIDIKVSDEIVNFFPTSGGVRSGGTGEKRLVVKLEKYYYCTKCKNNCFFTPDLLHHFKHCSKYISEETNYNSIKKISKSRRIRPPTTKIKPRIIDRQVFVINGVMVKCDKRLLVEDAKLRERPFVKLTKFYHCPNCDRNFVIGSSELSFHLKKRTPCVQRPKKTRTKTLGRPKSLIKRKRATSYECEICALKFKKEEQFTAHVESLHNGVIRYKCIFCSFVFSDLKVKLEHIAFNHLAIVPSYPRFRCRRPSCHRAFYNVSERDRHEKEHGDDILYKCVTCSRPFRTLSSFKSHVTGHGTPFQIACTDCTKIFHKSDLYRIHLHSAHQKGLKPLRLPQVTKQIEAAGPNIPKPKTNKNSNVEVLIDGIPELGESVCKNIGFQSGAGAEEEKPEVEVQDLAAEVPPQLQDSEPKPVPEPVSEPLPKPDLPPSPLPIVLPPPPPPPRKSRSTKEENKVEVLVETIPQNFEFMDIGKVHNIVPRRNKRVRKAIEVIEID